MDAGCLFCQIATVLQNTKERTELASIGCIPDTIVAKYACFACTINLQRVATLLEQSWPFSLGMSMSLHMNTDYLDIYMHLHVHSHSLLNLHVVAVPVFEHHTGLAMFWHTSKVFDGLCTNWKPKIIGISTDGESKMTGHALGVTTRFQQVAS